MARACAPAQGPALRASDAAALTPAWVGGGSAQDELTDMGLDTSGFTSAPIVFWWIKRAAAGALLAEAPAES